MIIATKTFPFGDHSFTFETGVIARQASGAVIASLGDTSLLCTVVGVPEAKPGQDFFPLTVDYREKSYAAGKIPGGYFKREGRPSEKETLISRLIDRPLRPLFPNGFNNEVQIMCTLLSLDPNIDADIVAINGASAALAISGIPFEGPVGAARVGYINNEFVLNPSQEQLLTSQLNLVVAGTKDAVLMVESEAKELSEQIMLDAVMFGHHHLKEVIKAIEEFQREAGKPAWVWSPSSADTVLEQQIASIAENEIRTAYQISHKGQRKTELKAALDRVVSQLVKEGDDNSPSKDHIKKIFGDLESKVVRGQILSGEPRIDGRDTRTVRPITIQLGKFPRTHGSAVFTRGETQALVFATLGTARDAQIIDDLGGEFRDAFMLHYNFPPFSVGEVGFNSSPKRREIGHGKLAKRAMMAVLPQDLDQFPYVLRVVSEITESNGSSSMASVCGTSLALMDAGVPISAAVAGIAMGLIKEENKFAVLTDILGDEDHLGDMDFKVAGTKAGVTALQMDIKINGITRDIMEVALSQALEARLHILGIMNEAISQPRTDISANAPRIQTMKIHPDKIREVIGKGGVTIRDITEKTGATIDIDDDGTIKVAAVDQKASDAAIKMIEAIVAEVEIGQIYEGVINKILDFGAFVEVLPGKTGLVHISQISHDRIENIHDALQEGMQVRVKVLEIDRQGRIRLSMKELIEN